MTKGYHALVKRLLDGELTLADLPPELRTEGEEALRLLSGVDRAPLRLSPALDAKIMAAVRRHAASPAHRSWRWLTAPRDLELRLRMRLWAVSGGALAAAAVLAVLVLRPPAAGAPSSVVPASAASGNSVVVRFVLYAPGAKRVTVAGTFNQWDQNAAPLVPAGTSGVWTTTLALPAGQHQYAFVVDGRSWIADPAAPAVDDGFGRRNSVLAVSGSGTRIL